MDIFSLELIAQIIMVIVSIMYVIVVVVKVKRITQKDNIIRDLREENLQLIAKLRGYLIDFEHMNIAVIKETPWRRIYVDLEDIFDEPSTMPYSAPMTHGNYYEISPEWTIIINGRIYDSSSELENKVKQE
jgi:hypothetical protein